MARYDAGADRRLSAACAQRLEDGHHEPRRASIGSIHGTVALPAPDLVLDLRTAGDPA
jgi:hypothetical protein